MSTAERWQRWYRKNRDRLIEKQRARRRANREAVNASLRAWRKENSQRLLNEPSRDPLYRKFRRCGLEKLQAAKAAGVVLNW